MARKETKNPLEGAAPGLQAAARPLQIQIGATPAPSSSPLMELANAFRDVNPELRGMLRDAAAREERDAMALGELEAQRTNAAQRMGEIESTLKTAVDEGKVSHVRLPAFERGLRLRAGKDLAQSLFQERLLSRLKDATNPEGGVAPEEIIAQTYADVAKNIPEGDIYGRSAFDHVAQGVMAQFRQRAREGLEAEKLRIGEERIADEGSEIVLQLADATDEDTPLHRGAVLEHLNQIRTELPKSEANKFYVTRVIAPAVERLISEDKYQEARNLLAEMDNIDVTGKGGILSQTAVAKSAFANMRAQIERSAKMFEHTAGDREKERREAIMSEGEDAGIALLVQLRNDNEGRLDSSSRFQIINEYSKANADNPRKVAAFTHVVNREFDYEKKARPNARAVAELEAELNALGMDDIEINEGRLEALWRSEEIEATDYSRLKGIIAERKALYGTINQDDFKGFARDVFPSRSLGAGIPPVRSANLGEATLNAFFERLPVDMQDRHEMQVSEFFKDALQKEVRGLGDKFNVPAEKFLALDRATVKAREFARTSLNGIMVESQRAKDQAKVIDQALAQRIPKLFRAPPISSGALDDTGGSPRITKELMETHFAELSKPLSERDVVSLPFKARGWLQIIPGMVDHKMVSMSKLAATAQMEGGGKPVANAKDAYGYAKSLVGFTPEEIKTGKTQHGITFDPAQIDPAFIPVFRNKEELDKHWNKGDPSELFFQIGDRVDPTDTLTPEKFYLAQLALLHRTK